MMVGDFDFGVLAESEAGYMNATIFFLLFVVLFNIVLLNITLAIIVDAYANAKVANSTHPSVRDEVKILAKHIFAYSYASIKGGQRQGGEYPSLKIPY